jgi:hypothetical protein
MTTANKPIFSIVLSLICSSLLLLTACSGQSGQRAAQGAGTGALAGAAGGLVSGLLWGGNPLESAVKGAAVGATAGAVVGGVSGAEADKAQAEATRQQQIAEFRSQIGEDAYAGVVALAECKHGVAEANAQVAAKSGNSNYALAGLWVETLSYADRGDTTGAQAHYPEIIKQDPGLDTNEQVDATVQETLGKLQDIRADNKLPKTCT